MKYKIYNTLFNIINESIDIYKDNSCFIEYFTPIFEVLNSINQQNFKNINIRKQKKEIVSKLYHFLSDSMKNRHPVSLQKEARKTEAIKEFVYYLYFLFIFYFLFFVVFRNLSMKKSIFQVRIMIQINKKLLKNN